MNFATMILPQRAVEALGWTLFHSLWQGALAALAFAVVLYFTRRYSSRLRYGLGLAVLALTLLASALTFWNQYRVAAPGPAAPRPATIAAVADVLPMPVVAVAAAKREPSRSQRIVAFFSDYFSRHLPLLVTLWLLGVLFLTLRFTGGMLYLQRLKYRQNRPLPPPWPERLQELAAKAGLKRPLQLLESLRLKTPVIIGHLKPVLLVPAGLVAGLPTDEVEALLAHELAHVLRRDYLVNVLQNLVEILYFFHPGVRWVSAAVRQEREHCCDDFAVALCGDAQHYARALARLQVAAAGSEIPFGGASGYPEPALAAVGRPQRLLERIVRLLGRPRLARDFREGFVSALLLVFGLLAVLKLATVSGGAVPVGAAAKSQESQTGPAQAANPFAHVSFELATEVVVRLSGQGNGGSGTWLVDERDGQVIWYMDLARAGTNGSFNAEVPLDRGAYSWYRPAGWKVTASRQSAAGKGAWQPLTMFIGASARHATDRHAGDRDTVKAEAEAEYQQQQAALMAERELREEKRLQVEKERLFKEEEVQKLQQQMRGMSDNERRLKEQELRKLEQEVAARNEAELKLKELELKLQQERLRASQMKQQAEFEKETLSVQKRDALAQLEHMRAEEEHLRVEEQRLRLEAQRLRTEEKNFQALITELTASGAVGRWGRYRVQLSAQALLVNGKKQPPALYERIKKFYEKQFNARLTSERTIEFVNGDD